MKLASATAIRQLHLQLHLQLQLHLHLHLVPFINITLVLQLLYSGRKNAELATKMHVISVKLLRPCINCNFIVQEGKGEMTISSST